MERGFSTAGSPPVFVLNRNAGRFRKRPDLVAEVQRLTAGRAPLFATTSVDEVDEAAAHAIATRAAAVVICGGDGTYLATVTALARAANGGPLPPLVLARGGTVSVVARNWGEARGAHDPVAVVKKVLHRSGTLHFVRRPTIAVVGDDGARRVGFTFGTGLVASFFAEYERAGAGGNRAALAITLRIFAESLYGGPLATRVLSPLPCRITADGVTLAPRAFSLVLCSVLRDVGLHMLVTHRAGEDPSRPHLVASPLTPSALGPQAPLVLLGRSLVGEGNFDGLVREFDVDFGTEPGPYVLDGDSFRAKRVTVSAGPTVQVAT